MVNMNKLEFYKNYIPAVIKALLNEGNWVQFNIKSPEYFLNVSVEKRKEIDAYIDLVAGQDEFLDNVAYYFDAKSHGFNEIDGVEIKVFKKNLEDDILMYKEN